MIVIRQPSLFDAPAPCPAPPPLPPMKRRPWWERPRPLVWLVFTGEAWPARPADRRPQ
ncbi:MAG: hypothetical protein ACR2JY_04290 [Chloroflexota bacterium]